LDELPARRFIGGVGLGAVLMIGEGSAETDPFDDDAPLGFVFSPLVGSPLTTSAKFAVVGKSPLTDRWNDSLASSGFALAGKRAGYDAIVIRGRAAAPSILLIDESGVHCRPAADLWGMDCPQAEQRLRVEYGGEYQFAVIGPAGERRVRFATISHDGRHAGRGGHGAVLGAKNIKAIAVRGERRVDWFDPPGMAAYAKELSEKSFGPATAKYRELGTAANLLTFNRLNSLPTRNFQEGSFAGAEQLAPETLAAAREKTRDSCAACTIGCEHIYQIGAGPGGVRMEYESLFALGPLCGVDDAEAVLRASRRCDELGLDTISTGGVIAFAMECAERGWLDEPWLQFGSAAALQRAVEEIGMRRGVGELLAEGSKRMSVELGGDAASIAPHVKGLEIPGYEPRAMQTMALGLAVGARGADHNRSGAYEADLSEFADRRQLTPRSAAQAIDTEDRAALIDSLILCKFVRGTLDDLYAEAATMLNLATGWSVDAGELRQTAKRIVDAKKLFNMRAGWTGAEDTLPERFFATPLPDDPRAALDRGQFEKSVADYYRNRGWDASGRLTSEQQRRLLLEAVVGD
jgi:aldehyde:ferredoxin oxidoreductase